MDLMHTHSLCLSVNIIILTRFLLGSSDTAVHHYRYKRHLANGLVCPLCRVAQQSELHLVLHWLVASVLRAVHPDKIPQINVQVISIKHPVMATVFRKSSVCLYKAFRLRSTFKFLMRAHCCWLVGLPFCVHSCMGCTLRCSVIHLLRFTRT